MNNKCNGCNSCSHDKGGYSIFYCGNPGTYNLVLGCNTELGRCEWSLYGGMATEEGTLIPREEAIETLKKNANRLVITDMADPNDTFFATNTFFNDNYSIVSWIEIIPNSEDRVPVATIKSVYLHDDGGYDTHESQLANDNGDDN